MRIFTQSDNLYSVEVTAALLNDPPPSGYRYFLPVTGFGLTSTHSEDGTELFRGFLKQIVEEWLRCGRRVMPHDAAVRASQMMTVQGYSTKGYSTEPKWNLLLVRKSGYEDGSLIQGKELDPTDPAYDSWLWRVYWDYLHRAPPNVWFLSDGEVCLNFTTTAYYSLEAPTALPPFLNADSPYLDSWMEAVLWFIHLLNSGYVKRFDRCTFCNRYFVRKRERKSGQVYKRGGASCGNCKGETAKARTNDVRDCAKRRMLDVAAEAWGGWKKSNRNPDRLSAVANRVNARCPADVFITTRKHRIEPLWVKRNEKAIVERVNQTAHNKGAD